MNCTSLLAVVAISAFTCQSALADARGLWLCPRKDACNTARADIPGNMRTAPTEVWSFGTPQDDYTYLKPVTVNGKRLFFAHVRQGVRLITQDGTLKWSLPVLGVSRVDSVFTVPGTRTQLALVQVGAHELALVDVVNGRVTWQWTVPKGAYLGAYRLLVHDARAFLVIFPQNTLNGLCFEISRANLTPKQLWTADYTGRYWQNFGPYFVLADMDRDKIPEIVLAGKPGYVGVIDLLTGKVKMDLKYKVPGGDDIGRPYGLIQAADIDGDGYPDVVVGSCQVEHYISVIRNVGGESLQLKWAQNLGYDLPIPERELRPNTTSLSDVNGDGKIEFVTGIFNPDGDNRWHTIAFDALGGYNSRSIDLPDRYFHGCYDINGDSRPDIIVSRTTTRELPESATIEAIDGRSGAVIGSLDQAQLESSANRLPANQAFWAVRQTPEFVTMPNGVAGLVVEHEGRISIWRVSRGHSELIPYSVSPHSQAIINTEGTGVVRETNLHIGKSGKQAPQAAWPLVSQADGRRELILALSGGRITGGTPDLKHNGVLKDAWTAPGVTPYIWIGKDGRRLVCAPDANENIVRIFNPTPRSSDPPPLATITAPHELSRPYSSTTPGLLPYSDQFRLLLPFKLGPHPVACAVYDEHGKQLWQDKENGPYPKAAAAADLNNDGQPEVFVDNHGKHIIYDASGKGCVVAHGWYDDIPGRSDGTKYALPIIGPYGPAGETRIVLGPGLDALEILDGAGARLAKVNYPGTYDFQSSASAVAHVRSDAGWDIGMVNDEGVFHCADAATGKVRWTLDLGCRPTAEVSVTAGDVDGDGRDNFLVGLSNGSLLALEEKGGKGRILWRHAFDAGVTLAYLADVDGDGEGEIVVSLDDGRVKILAGHKG